MAVWFDLRGRRVGVLRLTSAVLLFVARVRSPQLPDDGSTRSHQLVVGCTCLSFTTCRLKGGRRYEQRASRRRLRSTLARPTASNNHEHVPGHACKETQTSARFRLEVLNSSSHVGPSVLAWNEASKSPGLGVMSLEMEWKAWKWA